MTDRAEVTVVVSPRERFSSTRMTLETLLAVTPRPSFELIYVDGGVPREIRTWLEQQAKAWPFRLVGDGSYLSPDHARNLGLAAVDTKYVVFLDNDVVVSPGWLRALLACAEETGAWIAGPLYCVGRPFHTVVHMAGGPAHVEETGGARRFIERHTFMHKALAEVRHLVAREPTEQLEFHCLLARTEVMRRLGPLDPRFYSVPEGQIDLCMRARAQGGTVWLAPEAVVTYDRPPRLSRYDLPYYLLRWGESRARRGLDHFRKQWNLAADDPYFARQLQFVHWQRSRALLPLAKLLYGMPRWRRDRVLEWGASGLSAVLEGMVRLPRGAGW